MVFDKAVQALVILQGMRPQGGVAWGKFSDEIQRTGWCFPSSLSSQKGLRSELHVQTSDDENVANDVKMYVGLIETSLERLS